MFVHDFQVGSTVRASIDSAGVEGNGNSSAGQLSADGRYVAFSSWASNLVPGDTNGETDAFVHDLQTGATTRVSVDSAGVEGNDVSGGLSVSADGRHVVVVSRASNLVAGDANGVYDVYVHDRQSGVTERVSVDSSGNGANFASHGSAISADGRFVVFSSYASNLVPGDDNGPGQHGADVFVHDRRTKVTELVSVSTSGEQGNGFNDYYYPPCISGDGRFVAFGSLASNLVPGDTNGRGDVFVHDREPAAAAPFCLGDGTSAACPCANSGEANRGCENSASTGGAVLIASGSAILSGDTLRLAAHGELSDALGVFLQGDASIAPTAYGDGLRCLGGSLERLFVTNAPGGVVDLPRAGDPSVSARSAALGDTIPPGGTRYYQAYYRDPRPAFCPDPPGRTWNVSSGLTVVWNP